MTVDSSWDPKCTLVSTGRSLFPMSATASPIAASPTETSVSTLLMVDAMHKLLTQPLPALTHLSGVFSKVLIKMEFNNLFLVLSYCAKTVPPQHHALSTTL